MNEIKDMTKAERAEMWQQVAAYVEQLERAVETQRAQLKRRQERIKELRARIRTERTCRNTLPHDWGTFECSQCGGQYSVVPVYITAGGTPNDDPDPSCVNYCPNCGAKVVK